MSNDDPFEQVAKFKRYEGRELPEVPRFLSEDEWIFREELREEELEETIDGFTSENMVETADGLCDQIFVLIGTLIETVGVDAARECWAEVCRSNLDKFPGGVCTRNAKGKVQKPADWRPPDIAGVLRRHGWAP